MKAIKKIHLLPNVLTAFGLTCGLFVIFKLNMVAFGAVDEGVLRSAVGLLLLAGLLDLVDGAVARAMHAESEFGGIFDSLADAISFGVAPSVVMLKSLSAPVGTPYAFFATTAALIFSVCGVLRLVRFNVIARQAEGNEELEIANKKNFTGLPIPAAAAAAISLNLLLISDDFTSLFSISEQARLLILSLSMVVLGYFMVSRWKFPSLKRLQVKVSSFRTVFFTVIIAVVAFYGLMHHFAWVLALLAWSYLILAWALSLIRVIAGRRTKTLEDFEPEPDDDLIE